MAIQKILIHTDTGKKIQEKSDVEELSNFERTNQIFTALLSMTSIERLTSKEHDRSNPKIKTSACATHDLIKKQAELC